MFQELEAGRKAAIEKKDIVSDDKVNFMKRNPSLFGNEKRADLDVGSRRNIFVQKKVDFTGQGFKNNLNELREMSERYAMFLISKNWNKYDYKVLKKTLLTPSPRETSQFQFSFIFISVSFSQFKVKNEEIVFPVEKLQTGSEILDFSKDKILVTFSAIRCFNRASSEDEEFMRRFPNAIEYK